MKTSRLLTGIGAVALAATSVTAHAGTRAADAPVVAEPVKLSTASDVTRSTATAKKQSELGGPGLIIAVIAGIAIIVGIVIAADDDDDDFSPGG